MGLSKALILNMIEGVTKGFSKTLEISGVGYRAIKQGRKVSFQMGYSHPIEIDPPVGTDIVPEGANKIKVTGIDKEIVGQIAANIKAIRPVEPYKGKGIRYEGQVVRKKAGKAAAKGAGPAA